MLWKHPASYSSVTSLTCFLYTMDPSISCLRTTRHSIEIPIGDLDLWPMTLTYELDLDIHLLDLHAKIQVCVSVCSVWRVRRTDRHTHSHTMSKLLHPSLTLGVKIGPKAQILGSSLSLPAVHIMLGRHRLAWVWCSDGLIYWDSVYKWKPV